MGLFRNLLIAAAASLSLVGCITKSDTGAVLIGGVDVASVAAQVRDGAITACGFEPQVAQLIDFIGQDNSTVNSVQSLVQMVCTGAEALKTKRTMARPGALQTFTVKRGTAIVKISGRFVR